jgi:hypothetical protein
MLGNGAISWESKRQSVVSVSAGEAEYVALSEASREAKHLRNLFYEITNKKGCIDMFNDSQTALEWAHDPTAHNRTKHRY